MTISSRTGTIFIDANERVTPTAVTHGTMTVSVNEDFNVDQSQTVGTNGDQTVVAPNDPVITPDTDIQAEEETATAFVFDPGVSLSSLVNAINAVGATASDLVAILEALREAGALRAELIII